MRSAQLAGLWCVGVSDPHAPLRFRKATASELGTLWIDTMAQQSGRYKFFMSIEYIPRISEESANR